MPGTTDENARLQARFDRLEQASCIRLFTNGVDGGPFCGSGMASSSIILTRHELDAQASTGIGSGASSDRCVDIVLTKLRGTNGVPERQWSAEVLAADIFCASIKDVEDGHDILTPGLVLKVIDSESPSGSAKLIRDFAREAECYAFAKPLQGTVLPCFAGLFSSPSVHCLVFEDAGRRLRSAEYKMESVKQEALQALDTLHAAGVSPLPTERLLCRASDGRLKFSTLWESTTTADYTPEDVERRVRAHSAYQGWTAEDLQRSDQKNTVELLEDLFMC